jgi:hypothetical protein
MVCRREDKRGGMGADAKRERGVEGRLRNG